ncbi:hypothetical protein FGO68_gene1044 [Halteria grandinella]|uniref:Uncharacterized protein n=1 Tax=Halteria grandinella TaxID=5974 RepID=A0A8J8SWQ7_HALGN|nr:hypothetical protein FGO68_gene1044 [Halteria grandinella]
MFLQEEEDPYYNQGQQEDEEDYGQSSMMKKQLPIPVQQPVKAPKAQVNHAISIEQHEEIAKRLESSYETMDLALTCLASPENLANLKSKLDSPITCRVKIIKLQKDQEKASAMKKMLVISIYRVEIIDIQKKGFFIAKREQSLSKQDLQDNQCYLLDQVRISINRKGELVLASTTKTSIRQEKDDNFTVHSLELSQRDEEEYNNHQNELDYGDEEDFFLGGKAQPYPMKERSLIQFTTAKQVIEESERILSEEFGMSGKDDIESRLSNFRELLSWKMPDHFCSTTSAQNKQLRKVVQGNDGTILITNQINLYKLDFVTQRLKEQRVNFVGVVTHIKQYADKQALQKGFDTGFRPGHNDNMVNSQIDLESVDDKSRVAFFVRHPIKINLKDHIQKNQVLLVTNALRKVSNNLDIYVQLQYSPRNMHILGEIKEQLSDFQASAQLTLIKTIPTDSIVRHIIKICGLIVDINFIKVQYKCDVCRAETTSESVCKNGCFIKVPILVMQVLCFVQDGTSKASLELKNEKCIKAFGIGPNEIAKFKEYCLKNGTFMHPSNTHNFLYKEVLNVFRRQETFPQMLFYCKPYFKNVFEKNKGLRNANMYQETISKPSFLIMGEKEKEVFLNGEVSELKKVPGHVGYGGVSGPQRGIRRTTVCLKCLQVDENLKGQALRNVFNR